MSTSQVIRSLGNLGRTANQPETILTTQATREGSGKSALLRSLIGAFTVRIRDS